MNFVEEIDFRLTLQVTLGCIPRDRYSFVTGPGRSGAVAAVYASHLLGIPYLPHKVRKITDGSILVVDTAVASGNTIRKCAKWYGGADYRYMYDQTKCGRVKFWYEKLSYERGKGNEYA